MKKLTASLTLMILLVTGTAFAADAAPSAPEQKAQVSDEKGQDGPRRPGANQTRKRFRFNDCDKNNDGAVTQEEFSQCFPKGNKATFDAMDTNRDGKVTADEHKAWRESRKKIFQEKRTERQREAFKRCDIDGNGSLSLEEFMGCKPLPKPGRGKAPGKRPSGERTPQQGMGQVS